MRWLASSPKGKRATIGTIRARRSSASATCTSGSATSTSARAALAESRAHFEAVKDLAYIGRALQALALVDLVASRFTLAEDEYRKSSDSCRAAGDEECVAGAVAGLAFAQTAQEKFADGIASYKKAIEAFTALKRVEQAARAEIGLSRALTQSGAHAAALAAASHARQEAEKLVNDDVLWRAHVAEAEALRRLRERPKALAAASGAVAAVDRLLEVARIRPSAPVARDSSSAFAMLALLQAEDGDAASAFESAERMRAHDLRVLLAPGERDISRGMSDVERDEERTLSGELVSLHAQLSRERGLPKPDAARIARLEKAVTEAGAKRAAQQQALFESAARATNLAGLDGTCEPRRRRCAAAGRVHHPRGVRRRRRDAARRPRAARRRRDSLLDPVRTGLAAHHGRAGSEAAATRHAAESGGLACGSARAGARSGGRLRVSDARDRHPARGALARAVRGACRRETGYLADTTTIVYAPSVTALVRTPPPPAPARFVAAARGRRGTGARAGHARRDRPHRAQTGRYAAEPLAEQEANTIASGAEAGRAHVLAGAAATEAALREHLPQADAIHLGAPFRVNGASPLFSPVLLAPDPANDGALEAREVMNLDLHASVAVLADGASMTMRDAADEVGAVGWAWRAAGVPAIVLPRWAGDDAASTTLLATLHERLRAGDAPDIALQAARAKVRAAGRRAARSIGRPGC